MVRRDPVAADGWSPSAVQLDRNAFRQRATRRSVVLALVSSVAVLAASSALRYYLVTTLGERIVADLRRDVFAHLISS